MDNLKELSALTALNEMMAKGWFSISVIDKVGELLGVNPRCEAYRILAPLHCIDFDKMPDELRAAIPRLIQECLGITPIFQFKTIARTVIDVTPEQKPGGHGWLRLLGKR